jgi:2-keto-4-pentenoate hydratase/2-oxohepta-3-ene-1,7-dioic acid hydratase in catechol pathway
MRLATAQRADGRVIWGPIVVDRLADVSERWLTPADMIEDSIDEIGRTAITEASDASEAIPLDEVTLLPPNPKPARIICVGVNYADHAAESDRPAESPGFPVIFTRFASSLVGHLQPVVRPSVSHQFDWEGELAVVIGRPTHRVAPGDALRHVAGYSCFMDGTLRDWQRHTSQFTPGKNFDRSGSWGPSIVTADEIPDPGALVLSTILDGEVVQHASTADMIHDVAAIVSYCSTFTTLEPGDVIATGTPGGVGFARTPQRWLEPGSDIRVVISSIGTLVNPVVDESS